MLDWNSSPLGIILNLLSTISFYDSVDKLDNELNVKDEDGEDDLFLFSRLDLDFFLSLLLESFTISGMDTDEGEFFPLDLCRLPFVFV